MFPHLQRVMSSLFIPHADTTEDITNQLAWLMMQAQAQGYRDVDDLAARNGVEFKRLAAHWRKHQPTGTHDHLSLMVRAVADNVYRYKGRVRRRLFTV
jgi:hypothetical protein